MKLKKLLEGFPGQLCLCDRLSVQAVSNTALACVRTSFCFWDLVSHFGIVSRPHGEAASLRPLLLPMILDIVPSSLGHGC